MIYLDNAATTYPKPPGVYEKTLRFMKESAGNPGRGSHYFSNASAEMIENTRSHVARFFGIPDHRRVIFTYNCTDSLNLTLKGLLTPGDHVVTTCLDHNSVSRPLESMRRIPGIDITRVPFGEEGAVDPSSIRSAINHSTKLIVLTHGSNVVGSVQDLEAVIGLAAEFSIPVLLDAAQTAGRIRIRLGSAPVFLACSAHKALYGMPGLGLLTVPPGFTLRKWREGGSGSASESLIHPDDLPMSLEAGTPNFLAIASLDAGLSFIEQEGMDKIHQQELALAAQLTGFLKESSCRLYSSVNPALPVVAFNLTEIDPHEVSAILDQNFGIAVRSGLHCAAVLHRQINTMPAGCIRVSPGYFNTPDEINKLTQALTEIVEGYRTESSS